MQSNKYITKPIEGASGSVLFIGNKISIKILKNTPAAHREVLMNKILSNGPGRLIPPSPMGPVGYTTENIYTILDNFISTDLDLNFFKKYEYKVDLNKLKYDFDHGTFFILYKRINGSVQNLLLEVPNMNLSQKDLNEFYKNLLLQIIKILQILHRSYKISHGDFKFENVLYELTSSPSGDVKVHLYLIDFEWAWPLTDSTPEMAYIRKFLKINEYFQDEDNEILRPSIPKMTNNFDSNFKYGNWYHGLDTGTSDKYPRILALDVLALVYISILYNKFSTIFKPVFNEYFTAFCIISGNEIPLRKKKNLGGPDGRVEPLDYDAVSEEGLAKMLLDSTIFMEGEAMEIEEW